VLLVLRVATLALLLLGCAPSHLITKILIGQSRWPRRFLAAAAWIIGVRVRRDGRPVSAHSLILANHTNWLDIIVLGGATGAAFVSKDDLGHPVIHWLADQNHTVYVRRSDRRDSKNQAQEIAAALSRDQPVALFPEGTVGPGGRLLPFRSTLIAAANFAARDVEVRPVAIDYGAAATEIAWFEEPAIANIRRILKRRGTLPVTLHLLAPIDRSGDRKRITVAAREEIARTLGFKLTGEAAIA
jgi:1-acyl-sn-glycerol-3-phosphate acyltransferase